MKIALRSMCVCLLLPTMLAALADPVAAHYRQGCGHSFLTLRGEDGELLAVGESVDSVHGSKVTSRLTFRFRDGSIDDDTTVFDQSRQVRMVSDRHIQRGPSFPHPIDIRIDVPTAMVTSRNLDDGKETAEHLDLPADIGNGIVLNVIENLGRDNPQATISYVAAGSKPRIVKLVISSVGKDNFSIAGTHHKARKYEIKVELGGLTAVVAPFLGKEPKPGYVWVTGDGIPAVLKTQAQFYEGGPVWTVQEASPVWSSQAGK